MPQRFSRLALWQASTIALLFVGYAGYYLCRSDLSVAMPLIVEDLAAHGIDPGEARVRMGAIVSISILAYAIGKLVLSGVADFFGGKVNFLGGMGAAVLFTLLFALGGGLPIFMLAWVGNRFVQAGGWGGLVKITSKWFSYSSYGAVMGTLSLSYLFGDALARQFLGYLIGIGIGWQGLFLASAGVLTVILIANLILLKESREGIGMPPPETNPLNVFAAETGDGKPGAVLDLLRPFLRSRLFWLVCILALGTTLVRETFNTWTPTYLNQVVGYSKAQAGSLSSLFPFFGGVSVLLAGFLGDRLGKTGRGLVMTVGLSFTAAALLALAALRSGSPPIFAVALVSLVAFGLLGPFSYLGGAMALDLGGRKGGAVASGLIDGVGYLAGVMSGELVARISVAFGWPAVFQLLGIVAALSALAAVVLIQVVRRA